MVKRLMTRSLNLSSFALGFFVSLLLFYAFAAFVGFYFHILDYAFAVVFTAVWVWSLPRRVPRKCRVDEERVIDVAESREEIVRDVDGYLYWWPSGNSYGHMSSHHLRTLADELDRRNEPWDLEIEEAFRSMKEEP